MGEEWANGGMAGDLVVETLRAARVRREGRRDDGEGRERGREEEREKDGVYVSVLVCACVHRRPRVCESGGRMVVEERGSVVERPSRCGHELRRSGNVGSV